MMGEAVAAWWAWMHPMAVQSGVLLLAVLLTDTVLRRRGWPRLRLLLWLGALVKLLLPPTLASPWALLHLQAEAPLAAPQAAPAQFSFHPALMTAAGGVTAQSEAASGVSWLVLALFVAWLSGVAVVAAGLIRSRWRTAELLNRASRPSSGRLRKEAGRAAARAGLRRTPRLLLSQEIASPLVTGLWRPSVVLPADAGQRLQPADLANVLLHEMCHVRRGDLWTRHIASLLLTVYWFQPLLHWAVRRIEQLCEICCDASALRASGAGGGTYRDTLIHHARQLLDQPPVPQTLAGFASRPATLAERLRWLQRPPRSSRRVQRAACLGVAVFLALAVLPMADSRDRRTPAVVRPAPADPLDPAQRILEAAARGERPGCVRLRYAALSLTSKAENPTSTQ